MFGRFLPLLFFVLALSMAITADAKLPIVSPETVGFDAKKLDGIEPLLKAGIEQKKMPGCVVCIGRRGKIAYLRAFGNKAVRPKPIPMTTDTLFDLASLTKPIATATSIMILIDQEKLSLDDKAAWILPSFGVREKQGITIQHLLTHQSGLLPDNHIRDYQQGVIKAYENIDDLGLRAMVGEKFIYSDVNFIVLGRLVQKVSGKPLDQFATENLFQPLGMKETGFNPSENLRAKAAPTQQRNGKWMQGEVHDPRAYLLDGVAGHAGLFSTAEDLAIYAQMMLNGGQLHGKKILSKKTIQTMTADYKVSSGIRGLGWDKRTGYSRNKGKTFSKRAFGHGGFTGTVLWIDPKHELFFIFLSNRGHPDGKGSVNGIAGDIATLIGEAISE